MMSPLEMQTVVNLAVAMALGAGLGLERSLAGKHAGMRTYALVCLGAALFTATGVLASYEHAFFAGINPLQIAGSIAIGIGFIGAGLTAARGEHAELTTAAGVWLAAAVGVASGLGYLGVAALASVFGIVIFSLFARLEYAISLRYKKQDAAGKME